MDGLIQSLSWQRGNSPKRTHCFGSSHLFIAILLALAASLRLSAHNANSLLYEHFAKVSSLTGAGYP